jgi:hypothetical protein
MPCAAVASGDSCQKSRYTRGSAPPENTLTRVANRYSSAFPAGVVADFGVSESAMRGQGYTGWTIRACLRSLVGFRDLDAGSGRILDRTRPAALRECRSRVLAFKLTRYPTMGSVSV